jgi:hypothetical protein
MANAPHGTLYVGRQEKNKQKTEKIKINKKLFVTKILVMNCHQRLNEY